MNGHFTYFDGTRFKIGYFLCVYVYTQNYTHHHHQNAPLPFGKTEFVIAWVFRELTASLLFFKALWDPKIHWRTGTYKLKWGGIAEEIKKEDSNNNSNICGKIPMVSQR